VTPAMLLLRRPLLPFPTLSTCLSGQFGVVRRQISEYHLNLIALPMFLSFVAHLSLA
jgi:hypothetical protein